MTAPDKAMRGEHASVARAEKAEAALDRVRALADHIDQCGDLACDDCPTDPHDFVRMLRTTLDAGA